MTKKWADDWMAQFKAKPLSAAPRQRGRPRKPHIRAPSQWQSKTYQMEALDAAISAARERGYGGSERDYIELYLKRIEFEDFGAHVRAQPRSRVPAAEVRSVQQRLSRWRRSKKV
jgi:hypothetical protein